MGRVSGIRYTVCLDMKAYARFCYIEYGME